MTEKRSELKVVWVIIFILGAKLLGLDLAMILNSGIAEIAETSISGVPVIQEEIIRIKGENNGLFAILMGVVGVVYPACRTTLKAVTKWVDGQQPPAE